jgi:hypothetical protein
MCNSPTTRIELDLAKKRIAMFQLKQRVLDPDGKKNHLSLSCDPRSFLRFLGKITSGNYDGLRAYFGITENDANGDDVNNVGADELDRLTVIFVPTRFNAATGGHEDDTRSCWILIQRNLIEVNQQASGVPDTISRWILKYRSNLVLGALQSDGNGEVGNGFTETKSIWYGIGDIQTNSNGNGLIDYVRCLFRDSDPLIEVVIQFAAYRFLNDPLSAAHPYQLTLLYYFRQQTNVNKQVQEFDSFFSIANKDGETTDTGSPCPPDVSCMGSNWP